MNKAPLPTLIAELRIDEFVGLDPNVLRGAIVSSVAENKRLRNLIDKLKACVVLCCDEIKHPPPEVLDLLEFIAMEGEELEC